jgi:RNA polymerase sigma-70 factor (ECF subfamily)
MYEAAAAVPVEMASDGQASTSEKDSAFEDIVRRHQSMVFSLAYHFLQDPAAAEELAQDVFIQLYHHRTSIQSPAHLVFWLRKVAVHRSIDHLRRRPPREVSLDEMAEVGADPTPDDPLLSAKLRQLVAALPPKARMVLILRFQEDLELHEIADTLDMPVNTVKSSLRRSLAVLQAKLTRCMKDVKV